MNTNAKYKTMRSEHATCKANIALNGDEAEDVEEFVSRSHCREEAVKILRTDWRRRVVHSRNYERCGQPEAEGEEARYRIFNITKTDKRKLNSFQ